MSMPEAALPHRLLAARAGLMLPAFAGALLLSALLLFSVQPMFTKMMLPSLGGSPAVWSVAMVFFQIMLLLGYLWAHALTRLFSLSVAAVAHLCLTATAFIVLPLAWPTMSAPPAEGAQALWLVGAFAISVGLPFFALAGNGPLLQAWFARSGHRAADDPYFLYAASNAGSFVALLAYPFLIEPFFGLRAQSLAWTWGFAGLLLALALCAALALAARSAASVKDPALQAKAAIAWRDRLAWVGLSSVPSGLLVAATAHISTDIAAAPLLWVAPLALFLLTFIIAFRDRLPVSPRVLFLAHALTGALALSSFPGAATNIPMQLAVHLLLLFVASLSIHHALYKRRPPASALTDFYVCMSLGGALGGLFAALVAPAIFSGVYEYPILIVATFLCLPGAFAWSPQALRTAVGFSLFAGVALVALHFAADSGFLSDAMRAAVIASLAAPILILRERPAMAAGFAGLAALASLMPGGSVSDERAYRSFFGVHKIGLWQGGKTRILKHGTTVHGFARVLNEDGSPATQRPRPTGYYTLDGPMGEAIRSVRLQQGGRLNHIAAIGLGAGTLACHLREGEAMTFYEIDALVVDLARNSKLFPFLTACAPQAPIVLGDARLTIAGQVERSDLIIVDAFSSDAIPAHLLTREAVALYLSKLAPNGVIVLHISNRAMDLRATLARVAADAGLIALHRLDVSQMNEDYRSGSRVVAFVRDAGDIGALALDGGAWSQLQPVMSRRVWSDDYSTILTPVLDMIRDKQKADGH
jgi:spermidine synthase